MTKEVRKSSFAIYVAINCSDLSRGARAVLTDRGTAIKIIDDNGGMGKWVLME